MKDRTLTLIFIIVTAIAAVAVVNGYTAANKQLGASKTEFVQAICDKAHNETNGESEQRCGDAQDQTNTEYLCNNTGTSCWVEEK